MNDYQDWPLSPHPPPPPPRQDSAALRRKRTLKKCTVIDDPAAAVVIVDPPPPGPPCPDFDAIDAAEAAVARATEAVLRSNGDVGGRNFFVDDPPDLLMYHGYGGANPRLRRPNVRAYREPINAYGFEKSNFEVALFGVQLFYHCTGSIFALCPFHIARIS